MRFDRSKFALPVAVALLLAVIGDGLPGSSPAPSGAAATGIDVQLRPSAGMLRRWLQEDGELTRLREEATGLPEALELESRVRAHQAALEAPFGPEIAAAVLDLTQPHDRRPRWGQRVSGR